MDSNLSSAIVSASGTTLVAIVALIVNSKRMESFERRMDRLEAKLDHIEHLLVGYALDVARIKEKLGIT